MLTFRRSFIDDILIKETGKIIKNCKLYNIFYSKVILGRFYSGDNFSFIEMNKQKIRIDHTYNFFKSSKYTFYNQYTGETLGCFEIPNGYVGEAAMYLSNGETYQWRENNDHKHMMKPATWSIYGFDLFSKDHNVFYHGKMTPDLVTNYINPDQIFEGEIKSTNEQLYLPLFAGIYIMEEKFKRIEKDPG